MKFSFAIYENIILTLTVPQRFSQAQAHQTPLRLAARREFCALAQCRRPPNVRVFAWAEVMLFSAAENANIALVRAAGGAHENRR
jgi:hypothetical protein